jgi:hypothetical protein
MLIQAHPGLRLQVRRIGAEGATLLVIDNVVADPEKLVNKAVRSHFSVQGAYFPGLRARAPASYDYFLEGLLKPLLREHFGMTPGRLAFPMCHYSLVTTPPQKLNFLQRIPHFDSNADNGIATVHYLFRNNWGGTAFYRHRQTGFEIINEARAPAYFECLQRESRSEGAPGASYINGDTALFEQIDKADGVFNRMLVYRRNSLHSATIDNALVPPADPVNGRLSVNSFIDVLR